MASPLSTVQRLHQGWKDIPASVRRFFVRALLVTIAWKLLYLFVLMPLGQPNRWLTNQTAYSTAVFLNAVGTQPAVYPHYQPTRAHVYNERQQNLLIGNSCNGLELHILYIGFMVCLPVYSFRRWALYLFGGLLLIFALNILRCAGLYWLMVAASPWIDIAHKYIFKLVLYSAIAGLWYAYTRKA